jgi:alpha-L-rhamnosidase
VISYGLLCDIGYSADAGQQAMFSGMEVSNTRRPGNTLFKEDVSAKSYTGIYKNFTGNAASGMSIKGDMFQVSGGSKGVLFVADPSHNSMPMLRTQFATNDKKIASARCILPPVAFTRCT